MTQLRVSLTCKTGVPEPNIPDSLVKTKSVTAATFDGDDWVWDGTNVSLMRTPGLKLVSEQLYVLSVCYTQKIMRPLQACELMAMIPVADRWPKHWQQQKPGGRIFFAGTVYTLEFESGEQCGLLWYAWFDVSDGQWVFHCAPTTTLLREGDEFACVSFSSAEPIPDYSPQRKLAPPRRERERTVPRELLAIKR